MKILSVFRRKRKQDNQVTVANLAPVKLSTDGDDELAYIIAAELALSAEFEPNSEPAGWQADDTYVYPVHEATQPQVADTQSAGYDGGQSGTSD